MFLIFYLFLSCQGYGEGAVAAVTDGSKNGYFDAYDWVFRVNPDVIIQDDTWMLDTIKNDPEASLLYVECQPQLPPRFRNVRKIHTDFFALKLSAIPKGHLERDEMGRGAEIEFTYQMESLVNKGQHRHVPNTYPLLNNFCRANGNPYGPLFHWHDSRGWVLDVVNGVCPANFPNIDY